LCQQLGGAVDRCRGFGAALGGWGLQIALQQFSDEPVNRFGGHLDCPPIAEVVAHGFQMNSELWAILAAQLVIGLKRIQQF
jgi:hypothetical protein